MIESAAMVGDNDALLFSKAVHFLSVNFKTDVYPSFIEKHYFGKVVELVEQNSFSFFMAGFKELQNLSHKVAVRLVLP